MTDDELVQIRRRGAPRLWRDLEEYRTGSPPSPEFSAHESSSEGWSRRSFMQLMAASLAMATLEGCDRTVPEQIVPYSVRPREVQPGIARYYATAMMVDGFATGLLVESHEGRPTKVEGNPAHPASLGGTGLAQQAWVLGLYDPDRARRVQHGGNSTAWEAAYDLLLRRRPDGGARLRLLLEPTSSPTVARLLGQARAVHPRLKVTFHQPVAPLDNTLAGATLACGRPLQPLYDFTAADVILALDADPLGQMPFSLRYCRQWAGRRHLDSPRDVPNRMYVVEALPSVTGMSADHRLRRRSAAIPSVAETIAARLPGAVGRATERDPFIEAVARDLTHHPRGSTLVVVGERQPAALHALGWAMNDALGNLGRTVRAVAPQLLEGDQDLAALVAEMADGAVDTLLMLEGNPVYTAPVDLHFEQALSRVPERVYLSLYDNETAQRSNWLLPATHPLESWGDGRAYDGTLSLVQPLVHPLTGGRTITEVLALLGGDRQPDAHRLLLATHEKRLDIEAVLQQGLVPDSAAPLVQPTVADPAAIRRALATLTSPRADAIEINFHPSPTVGDGRFTNNAWLLEQPTPLLKLTWDNAVLVSPKTASSLGLHTQDLVEVELQGRRLRGPIFVTPGHADGAASLWLGWGRQGAESLAAGRGFDAYRLRSRTALGFGEGQLRRIGGTEQLATTQRHFDLHGRPIALATTLSEYRRQPDFADDTKGQVPSLMPPYPYEGLQWAMSIDLSICTGCSACMLACQSENNLPVVGKREVLKRRQMHWLRIDSYYHGALEDPGVIHQPMLCQHCEMAPCEYVCPVNATVHSSDGLNEMVYNRCVGTRFCSNNCPYKVRRFNWFNWNKHFVANQGSVQLAHNPDVTVRDRGVMEKCTYCVQRIRRAEIRAGIEDRALRPGEVVTACQQACPTGAIQFGSLSHPETPMVQWRQQPRAYSVLNDQGTRPRTMYLARIDNPNPELG